MPGLKLANRSSPVAYRHIAGNWYMAWPMPIPTYSHTLMPAAIFPMTCRHTGKPDFSSRR